MDWTPIWHQAAAPAFAMGFLAGKKKQWCILLYPRFRARNFGSASPTTMERNPTPLGTDRVGTGRDAYRHAGQQLCFHGSRGGKLLFGCVDAPSDDGEELEIRLYYASKVMDSNMIEENAVSYQEIIRQTASCPHPGGKSIWNSTAFMKRFPGWIRSRCLPVSLPKSSWRSGTV